MATQGGQAEFAKRMHRALEYIDKNLDRSIALAELADVAHFSAFHFHRVFAAWLGETSKAPLAINWIMLRSKR